MKKACGLTLTCWLGSAAILAVIAYQRVPNVPLLILPCLGAGFVALIGWMYLIGIGRILRERASIAAGIEGEPLPDGKLTAAVGRIVAIGSKIHSPFTQTPCVLYEYEIQRHAQNNKSTLFKGMRMVPCAVQTRLQTIRLLAHTKLEFPAADVEGKDALLNAREYTRTTTFRELTLENIGQRLNEIKGIFADDDGDVRTDDKFHDWSDGPNIRLTESVLAIGEEVCAVGLYSSERRGLVPNPGEIHSIHIYKGAPERVLRSFAWKAFRYLLAAIFFLGGVVAAAIAFWRYIPPRAFG